MITRTICFEYLDDLELEFRPAVLELNPIFVACVIQWVHPLQLAAKLPEGHPRKLSEERATAALRKVYANGVLQGELSSVSDDRPATPAEWEAWLESHPAEFDSLRSVAECPENFQPPEEPHDELRLGV